MTEGEAKEMPCIGPMPYNTGVARTRTTDGALIYVCAGAACMAWRWAEPYVIDKHGAAHNANRKEDEKTGRLKKVEPGFCGLAGKP